MDIERSHANGKLSILLFAQVTCAILTFIYALGAGLAGLKFASDDSNAGYFFFMFAAAGNMVVYWGLVIVFAHTRSVIAESMQAKLTSEKQVSVLCPNGHSVRCGYAEAGTRIRCAACGAWTEIPSFSRLGPADTTTEDV